MPAPASLSRRCACGSAATASRNPAYGERPPALFERTGRGDRARARAAPDGAFAAVCDRACAGAAGPRRDLAVLHAPRQRPDLEPRAVRKPVLIALSHAIEDEVLARAEAGVMFACFQREGFYRSSQARWRELSATARAAAVFADFEQIGQPDGGPGGGADRAAPAAREGVGDRALRRPLVDLHGRPRAGLVQRRCVHARPSVRDALDGRAGGRPCPRASLRGRDGRRGCRSSPRAPKRRSRPNRRRSPPIWCG